MTTETPVNTGEFFQTLTMAELGLIETATGIDLANDEGDYMLHDMLAALVMVAARRLSHPLTIDEAGELTLEQTTTVLDAAAGLAPTTSEATSALLAAVMGKDHGRD
ncbi:hypothetical protein [Trueperella abortisuis]|uniref:hypothetical protein n=1 Tax=Trueperella abortisuis TaxID=445930 RepID=UPI0028934894|nr:hypothetical protein [Trueperella abortisuis]